MRPIFRSRFDIVWDGMFVILSVILLLEIPMYIYGPTEEIFIDNQLFLIPLILIIIAVVYSFKLEFVSIYQTLVVIEKPFGISNRKKVINRNDITQVEIEPDKRPTVTIYHHAEGTSLNIYEDEVSSIKKAFAQIEIFIE